jgi:hypothetical protein
MTIKLGAVNSRHRQNHADLTFNKSENRAGREVVTAPQILSESTDNKARQDP